MTKKEYFNNMEIKRDTKHFCMFCDNDADFVIKDGCKDFSMCNECAELFKNNIEKGMRIKGK